MAALLCKKSSLPLRFLNFMKKLQKKDDSSRRLIGVPPNIYSIRSRAFNSSGGHNADEAKDMFEAWIIEHKKVYNTPEEKEKRFQNFRENLHAIEKHNSTGNSTYWLGLTKFSDLTAEEFGRMYLTPIDFCFQNMSTLE
ncbi:putative actinidain [Helianthus anomalus]